MEISYSVVEVVVYTVNVRIKMLAKERSTLSGFYNNQIAAENGGKDAGKDTGSCETVDV